MATLSKQLSVFFDALDDEDVEKVEELLNAGIDPNCRDEDHYPAICVCAHYGNIKLLKLLIDHGADISSHAPVDSIRYVHLHFISLSTKLSLGWIRCSSWNRAKW